MANNITRANPSRAVSTPQLPVQLLPLVDLDLAPREFGSISNRWLSPPTCPAFGKALLPAAIEAHKRAMVPADPPFIVAHLTRLAAHYPANRTEHQWQFVLEDMIEDLGNIPPDILLEAIKQHRRRSVYYPKVCEILELAEPLIGERRWNIDRMQRLLALPTPEEKAEAALRDAERHRVEYAEQLKVRADLRIFERWRPQLGQRLHFEKWQAFLAEAINRHDEATIDSWHSKIAGDAHYFVNEPLNKLRTMEHAASMGLKATDAEVSSPAGPGTKARAAVLNQP